MVVEPVALHEPPAEPEPVAALVALHELVGAVPDARVQCTRCYGRWVKRNITMGMCPECNEVTMMVPDGEEW